MCKWRGKINKERDDEGVYLRISLKLINLTCLTNTVDSNLAGRLRITYAYIDKINKEKNEWEKDQSIWANRTKKNQISAIYMPVFGIVNYMLRKYY
jgi:hypothetical protein